ELLAAEYRLRHRREPGLSPADYFRRFPAHRALLEAEAWRWPAPPGGTPVVPPVPTPAPDPYSTRHSLPPETPAASERDPYATPPPGARPSSTPKAPELPPDHPALA